MSSLSSPSLPAAAVSGNRAGVLADLRARIRRIEGIGGDGKRTLSFGVEAIDAHLPDGGLPLGCLHAVAAEDPGAGTGFAAALLARLATPKAPVLWILRGRDLHAPGLAAYGLTPDRLIAVRAARPVDALWAMEEALRCSALSAVLGELEGLDLTASRRLQLAAESTGVTGILLDQGLPRRRGGLSEKRPEEPSAVVTRWRLGAAPSRDDDEDDPRRDGAPRPAGSLPGLGGPRWTVALERCRGGRPGSWTLAWEQGAWQDVTHDMAPDRDGPYAGSPCAEHPGGGRIAEERPGTWPMSDNRHGRSSGSRLGSGR